MPSLRIKKAMFSLCAMLYEELYHKWFPRPTSTHPLYGKKVKKMRFILKIDFNVVNVIYSEFRKSSLAWKL